VRWLLLAVIAAFPVVLFLAFAGINAQDEAEIFLTPEKVDRAFDAADRFEKVTNVVTVLGIAAIVGTALWLRQNAMAIPKARAGLAIAGVVFMRGDYAAGWIWSLVLAVCAVLTLRSMGQAAKAP
jgi:hypothetical protein